MLYQAVNTIEKKTKIEQKQCRVNRLCWTYKIYVKCSKNTEFRQQTMRHNTSSKHDNI